MKITSFIVTAAIASSALASSLVQQATEAGMKPIPSSNAAVLKLIDDKNNPITEAKVELGKKLYFDPRLSKS